MASAGLWPFALSEIGAKPNTCKDPGTKLLEISAILFLRHILKMNHKSRLIVENPAWEVF